jgi:predicted GNAT superfamily acetyltransferase
MALVDERFSEKDSLKTEIFVNVTAIEHAVGENWKNSRTWRTKVFCLYCSGYQIVVNSIHEANLYVLLTHKGYVGGLVGLAYRSVVCRSRRSYRYSITG